MVAVQLAAQTYSARVIEIIKGNNLFLTVIASYIIAIIYGLFLLIYLDYLSTLATFDMLLVRKLVLFEYYISFWIFLALIPLFISILNSLKPSKMIDILAKKIDNDGLKSAIKKDQESGTKENGNTKIDSRFEYLNYKRISTIPPDIEADNEPIQPIIDIIQNSLTKNDFETLKHGFKVIGTKMDEIIGKYEYEGDKEVIIRLIVSYLSRIGMQAVEKEDDGIVKELIELMDKFTKTALNGNFIDPVILSADSLAKICRIALKKELETSSVIISTSLGEIGEAVSKKNIKDLTIRTSDSIAKIGRYAIDLEFDDTIYSSVYSIGYMARVSPKGYKIRPIAIKLIGDAGKYSATKQIEFLADISSCYLLSISKIAINDEDIDSIRDLSNNVTDIGLIYLEQGLMDESLLRGELLYKIAINCVERGLEEELIKVQRNMVKIAKKAIEKEVNFVEIIISKRFVDIAKLVIETEKIVKTIKEVPIISGKFEFRIITDTIKNYEKFSSNRIVNTVVNSITNIAKLTVEQKTGYSTEELINLLFEVYKFGEPDNITFVNKLGEIGEKAIEKGLYQPTNNIVDIILDIIKRKLKSKNSSDTFMIAVAKLGKIAVLAMDQELKEEYSYKKDKSKEIYLKIIDSLIEFAKINLENADSYINFTLLALGNIGKKAAELGYDDLLNKIIDFSEDIGKSCVEIELTSGLNGVSFIFGAIGEIKIKKGLRKLPFRSIHFFYENIKSIIEMEAHIALTWAVYSLQSIGKIATEKKFIDITNKSIILSEVLGKSLIDMIESEEERTQLSYTLYYLLEIGKTAIDLSDWETTVRVKITLKNIAIYAHSKDLEKLKEFIKDYISELEELEKKDK